MRSRKSTDGMGGPSSTQRCAQCHKEKTKDHFLQIKKRGFKITKCNECAQANMRRWAATGWVGRGPDSVKGTDE